MSANWPETKDLPCSAVPGKSGRYVRCGQSFFCRPDGEKYYTCVGQGLVEYIYDFTPDEKGYFRVDLLKRELPGYKPPN